MPSFLNSLTQIFSPSTASHSTSTSNARQYPSRRAPQDPFSLPQHQQGGDYGQGGSDSRSESPAFGYSGHSGAFRSDSPSDSRKSSMLSNASTYSGPAGHTYPPPSTASGFNGNAPTIRPPARTGSSGNFFSPNGPLVYYPPLHQTWSRIKRVLGEHVPELLDTLNPPILLPELQRIEAELGIMLPPSVRDSYLCVDGQDPSADFKEGMFFGLTLLPLEDVLREWSFWRRVEYDPTTGQNPELLALMSSIPPGWIKPVYACRGWLPLIADKCGNYVGVDLDPPGNSHGATSGDSNVGSSSKARQTGGAWGQVILFGRDFDRKCVLWRGEGEGGWGRWLAGFAEELESGAGWEINDRAGGRSRGESGNDPDDDSEDDIGYSSYYFDSGGATGSDGQGLRLTGEYRGWGVMEAWWDRSVRRWEELGLGLHPEELKRQQEEIERSNLSAPDLMGLGFGGMRIGTAGEDAQVAIPVLDNSKGLNPSIIVPQTPSTPTPETALLAARSPFISRQSDASSDLASASLSPGLRIGVDGLDRRESSSSFKDFSGAEQRSDLPIPSSPRILTPHGSDDEPPTPTGPNSSPGSNGDGSRPSLSQAPVSYSSADGMLSPYPQSPPVRRAVKRVPPPPPAPIPLDLPTRADVQAAEAVASAEARGLRGGWVMSMEAISNQHPYGSASSSRRSTISTVGDDIGLMTMSSTDKGKRPMRGIDNDNEVVNGKRPSPQMENIDLEGGRSERFGSNAGPSRFSVDRNRTDNPPNIDMESRRSSYMSSGSGVGFSGGLKIRTPSPSQMMRPNDATPRPTNSSQNSSFLSDNPFDQEALNHEGSPHSRSHPDDVAPDVLAKAMPGKDVQINIQHDDDDLEGGMQDVTI